MKISKFFALLYLIGSIIYAGCLFYNNDISQGLLLLSYLLLLLVPELVKRLFKVDVVSNEVILSSYYVFLILSSLFGVFLRFYSVIYWYDDFVHFLSGFLVSYFGLLILKSYKIKNINFSIIFIIAFSLAVASLWEFFEYSIDLVSDKDLQKVALYGVNDTMNDMLMAFTASIIFSMSYLFKSRKM